MDVMYTIVPCICSGVINSKINENETYEVIIYNSPLGELSGPLYASLIHSPGAYNSYKKGDFVKVWVPFTFGGVDNTFIDVQQGAANYIMGHFAERSIANVRVNNPISEDDVDRRSFINQSSGAGLVATDEGKTLLSTNGSIFSMLSPFGVGVRENMSYTAAQNYHRIISHNGPAYLSREHFGLYTGDSTASRITNILATDFPIVYRRFVQQNRGLDNWVSSCEGTYAPWIGANNNFDNIKPTKQVLFSKIINYDKKRITIEAGDASSVTGSNPEFLSVRVDDVKFTEKTAPIKPGAISGLLGNRMKINISDKGELEIKAAGSGTPLAPKYGFSMTVDEKGVLKIHAAAGIELSHGTADAAINSITMDPKKGVDIIAKSGFRVNGKELVNANFIDWMIQNKAGLCQTVGIGAPAPISVAALPTFVAGAEALPADEAGSFLTKGLGIPAPGIILEDDIFETV